MSDLFNPDWKPGEQQTQSGQQTKNNIPIVQTPINFEAPKPINFEAPTDSYLKKIASNIPSVQIAKIQEEQRIAEQQAKAQADLELKKQQELQAKLQTEATKAQKNIDAFANISENIASTNNDASKIAKSQV